MTKISCDVNKIAEEISDVFNGSFVIKNIGGGLLSGNIMTDNDIISFDKYDFEGNSLKINFYIDVTNSKPQKLLKMNIYIISNGGEITIPVFVKVLKNVFYTDDNFKISSIKDFFSYYKKAPQKAIDIFYSEKFFDWLLKMDFERTHIMKLFLSDSIKERAIDNFFIFHKLKKKAFAELIEKNINVFIKPFQTDMVSGSIVILKKGYGYIRIEPYLKLNSPWINVKKNVISSGDFNAENRCYVEYVINPSLINNNFSFEVIIVDKLSSVKINVYKLPKIIVKLSEEIYDFDDFGYVFIQNNCDEDLLFELSAKDNFIEFQSKKLVVSDEEKVYFKIKRSKIQYFMSKVSFNKKLYTESEIYVKTVFKNRVIIKTKKVVLGMPLVNYDSYGLERKYYESIE